jgi:hypothetical protein
MKTLADYFPWLKPGSIFSIDEMFYITKHIQTEEADVNVIRITPSIYTYFLRGLRFGNRDHGNQYDRKV